MVMNDVSGREDDSRFAARPILEQTNKCEQMINKVNSILESLNIPVSRYENELDDLKFTFSSFSDSLKQTRLTNSDLTDQLSRVSSKVKNDTFGLKICSEIFLKKLTNLGLGTLFGL